MSKEKKGYGKAICTIVGLLCIFLFKFLPAPLRTERAGYADCRHLYWYHLALAYGFDILA